MSVGDEALYVVKRAGVYRVMLADEIDPKRTNPAVPNAYQRVLPVGASDPVVVRLLLGANYLLRPAYLGETVDAARGLRNSFEALTHIVTMQEIARQLETGIAAAAATLKTSSARGTVALPSVPTLTSQVTAYFRHCHDALQAALELIKLFHGQRAIGGRGKDQKKLSKAERRKDPFAHAATFMQGEFGPSAPLARLLNEAQPFASFVWNVRNKIEHPQPTEHVVIKDFSFDPGSEAVDPPTFEVVSASHEQPPVLVTEITALYVGEMVSFIEQLLAVLCDQRVRTQGGFTMRVVTLRPDQWPTHRGRFAYEIEFSDGSTSLGS